MISAYRDTDRTAGLHTMSTLIDALSSAAPTELTELITLGRTLKRRGRRRPRLPQPARHQQRPHRGHL